MTQLLGIDPDDAVRRWGITRIIEMAFVDPLTGLPNRNRLAMALERREQSDRQTVFVRIDLDGFKAAQDAPGRGHEWGDACLAAFAQHVASHVRLIQDEGEREGDMLVAREGGDEFVVLTNSYHGAARIAHVVSSWTHQGVVSASVGIGETVGEADAALYEAKAAKKQRQAAA